MKQVKSKQLCHSILTALANATSCANELLQGDDLQFVEATYPDVKRDTHQLARRVLTSINSISSRYAVSNSSSDLDSDHSGSSTSLRPRDIVFDQVSECTDEALEQFNTALDVARGIKDAILAETGALGPNSLALSKLAKFSKRQPTFTEMEKPQVHFLDYPIDNSDTPFLPQHVHIIIRNTYKAKEVEKSCNDSRLGLYMQGLFKANSKQTVGGVAGCKHPYEDEIFATAEHMSKLVFNEEDTAVYKSVEETPFTFVSTEEELFAAAERIKSATEIAVDIENHSVRSFQGFTCLIQISTRREDFVIDTLALRGSIHRALASIFANETTVKVLHGADKDIQWLERDFGIYIVNLFDTGQAARQLRFSSASLAYLLVRFCNISATTATNKRAFQLADWRQRPLPEGMLAYARSDTHYLLYIYDRLRADLSKRNMLGKVWEKSATVSQKRYSKFRFDPSMARQYTAKFGLGFDPHQTRLLEELCRWRDRTAREEDESLAYVAPLNTLFDMTRARDKARTVDGLLKHGFPSKVIPLVVRARAEELVRLVCNTLDAKLDEEKEGTTFLALNKPESMENLCDATGVDVQKMNVSAHNTPKAIVLKAVGPDMKEDLSQWENVKVSQRSKPSLCDLSSSESSSDEGESATNFKSLSTGDQFHADVSLQLGAGATNLKDIRRIDEGNSGSRHGLTEGLSVAAADDDMRKPRAIIHTLGTAADAVVSEEHFTVLKKSGNEHARQVKAASKSTFDLSDDESEDAERAKAVAHVRAGLKLHTPQAPVDFCVETDKPNMSEKKVEENELVVLGKRKAGVTDFLGEIEELEPLSLISKYKKQDKKIRKKRRKVQNNGEERMEAERLPAFDYRKAARENDTVKAKKTFDPLQRLSEGRKNRGKDKLRKSKKRPGSGMKSMSFRARS